VDDMYVSASGEKINSFGSATANVCVRGVTRADVVSQRPGFSREDYYRARPEELLPTNHEGIVVACQELYKKIGLVRNMIDLMADFASDGVQINHRSKAQQRFYRQWAQLVNLPDRIHTFQRNLLRDGNVICRRTVGTMLSDPKRRMVYAARRPMEMSQEDFPLDQPGDVRIPIMYTFISPAIACRTGGGLGKFVDSKSIDVRIPQELLSAIQQAKQAKNAALLKKIPADIMTAIDKGQRYVTMDESVVWVDFYKKDDWEAWGTSFLYAVMEDILFKSKMRLADMAALDGVINAIRIWKLGNSDKEVLPTSTAVNKLLSILQNNTGGGVMDLVWDDMIDLKVEYPPLDKILGGDKYKGVNADIVRGLGIPDLLVGGSDTGTKSSSSTFVQLKTLSERLEYVRMKCVAWLKNELDMIRRAMGWVESPSISFNVTALRDEVGEKRLLIQLLDRGIITVETVHQAFGREYLYEIEGLRQEEELRQAEPPILERAGPYYRPKSVMTLQFEQQLRLAATKTGSGDTGGGGDNPLGDLPRQDGDGEPGRPPSTPDSSPRERNTKVLGTQFLSIIYPLLDDVDDALRDSVAWAVLCAMSPCDPVTLESVSDHGGCVDEARLSRFTTVYNRMASAFASLAGSPMSDGDRMLVMGLAWSEAHARGLG